MFLAREFVIIHDYALEEEAKKVGTISEVMVSEQSILLRQQPLGPDIHAL